MGLLTGMCLLVLGCLAAPGLMTSLRPALKDGFRTHVRPYRGWIGALSAMWGAWGVIHALFNIGAVRIVPLWWASYFATAMLALALGVLLGISVLKTLFKSPALQRQLECMAAHFIPHRRPLGHAAMICGLWCIVVTVIY